MKTLLDGLWPDDLKCSVAERPLIPTPQLNVIFESIPGRDGSLTIEDSYEDIEIKVKYNILEDINIKPLIRKIKGFLVGKNKLQFDDDNIFYKIKNIVIDDIDNEIYNYGAFYIVYRCDPFQYDSNLTIENITNGKTINYLGTRFGQPTIKLAGTGKIRIFVNEKEFVIKSLDTNIIIDSELENAYKGSVNLNHMVDGEYPILNPGNNTIRWIGTLTSFVCEVRNRYI